MGLLLWNERPVNPPACKKCGYPAIYKLGVCQECYDDYVESKIDELKEIDLRRKDDEN